MSKIFETSDEEVTNPATSLAKASQALALLDVSQEGHGLDSSISVSSKNPFEDKASTLQTELPAILENASQHSLQSKDGNPGKRPVLPQLELSPAAKQRRGLIAALQRHAMEVHVDIMVPGSVDDVDGTEKRVKASISTSKSPNGTGKSAEMEWKDLELLPERTVNQDIQILDSGRDENRNIDSTSAENTYGSPDSTGDDATPKASIRSVQAIVTPMKKTVYETHILRDMKGPCCSSNSPDKTCKPRIAASIPSHETESGFEPVTAIRLRRGRSHRSVASPPDRDVLELGTQQGADGQKSVNDTSIEGVDYQHDPRSTQTAKHNQGRKRQRKYTVRSSGSPVRTDDDTADAEFSVGEVQVLQVEQMVFRFSSPNPEIHLTSPSALSRSISSYASAKSTIQATMRASGLTEADDPFISKPEEEISILQRNLDECAKVDQQSVSKHKITTSDSIRVRCRRIGGVVGLTFVRIIWTLPIPSLLRVHPLHANLKHHLHQHLRMMTTLWISGKQA